MILIKLVWGLICFVFFGVLLCFIGCMMWSISPVLAVIAAVLIALAMPTLVNAEKARKAQKKALREMHRDAIYRKLYG